MDGIVLGRIGHYFDAGNGSCRTALIVGTFETAEGVQAPIVNVTAWQHGGDPFTRTSVPVVAEPSAADTSNSFHLAQACPWHK